MMTTLAVVLTADPYADARSITVTIVDPPATTLTIPPPATTIADLFCQGSTSSSFNSFQIGPWRGGSWGGENTECQRNGRE